MANAARKDAPVDTSTWLTCREAADLLRVSENTIRAWGRRRDDKDGRRIPILSPLRVKRPHPSGATREVDVYDPQQLAAIAARRRSPVTINSQGEVAARAFEMFDRGEPLREIVVQLRELPERVAELHEQWMSLGGADLVIGATARAELARFLGDFSDVADLVDRVRDRLGERVEVAVEDGSPLDRASDAEVERAIVGVIEQVEPAAAVP